MLKENFFSSAKMNKSLVYNIMSEINVLEADLKKINLVFHFFSFFKVFFQNLMKNEEVHSKFVKFKNFLNLFCLNVEDFVVFLKVSTI